MGAFIRLSTTTYPDSSTGQATYDADSNVLTSQTRKGDTIAFGYDTLNRLCTKTIAATATACGGTSISPLTSYAYDPAGRLLAVNDNSAAIVGVAAPGGTTAQYATATTYDALNRPISASWTPAAAQTTPSQAGVTFAHTYDGTNRRIGQTVTDNGWWSYPGGPTSVSYTANDLNQYGAVGATTPTYDANGNLTWDGTFTYCYDAEGRLTGILSSGTCASPVATVASYAYDAQGRRKSKTVGATTTIYVTDANDNEVLEYDGTTGAVQRWYAYGPGLVNEMDVAAGTRQTMIPDLQGSILAMLDASSGVLTTAGYQTYGENPSLSSGTFRYTGQRFDAETAGGGAQPSGLYYLRARMYSPSWGRFLQPDPAGYAAGDNLYAYVGNDPLNGSDPSGMCFLGCFWKPIENAFTRNPLTAILAIGAAIALPYALPELEIAAGLGDTTAVFVGGEAVGTTTAISGGLTAANLVAAGAIGGAIQGGNSKSAATGYDILALAIDVALNVPSVNTDVTNFVNTNVTSSFTSDVETSKMISGFIVSGSAGAVTGALQSKSILGAIEGAGEGLTFNGLGNLGVGAAAGDLASSILEPGVPMVPNPPITPSAPTGFIGAINGISNFVQATQTGWFHVLGDANAAYKLACARSSIPACGFP